VKADPNSQSTARDVLVDDVADLGLEHFHFPGQIDGNLALLTVHRTEFDRDLKAILGAIPAPISRHRFHRWKYAKFRFFTRIKCVSLNSTWHFQSNFRRSLRNIFIAAPGQIHNDQLVLSAVSALV